MSTITTGKPIAWAVKGGKFQQVDELKEAAIQALEQLESIMSEAAHAQRYDVLSNVIRCFYKINSVLVEESKMKWVADHPGQEVM